MGGESERGGRDNLRKEVSEKRERRRRGRYKGVDKGKGGCVDGLQRNMTLNIPHT